MEHRLRAVEARLSTLEDAAWQLETAVASLELRLLRAAIPDVSHIAGTYEAHYSNLRTLLLDVRTAVIDLQAWRSSVHQLATPVQCPVNLN